MMKRVLFALLSAVLFVAPAAAQLPSINGVAGPTTSRELGSIITNPFGTPSTGDRLLFATPANNGVLVTNGSGVPSISTTLPNGLAMGTPLSLTLTNATGLPIATGISGLGSGVATFLVTPSSANLAASVTDETGSGSLVFATSPTLVTPNIGAATGTSLSLSGTLATVGSVGIGTAPLADRNLYMAKQITGGTTAYGLVQIGAIQSDVTSHGIGIRSAISTAAAAFTLNNAYAFYAAQSTIGAGSAINSQYGLFIENSITGATSNYGVYAQNAAAVGSGKTHTAYFTDQNVATGGGTTYAFRASGTAQNVFTGPTTLGSTLTYGGVTVAASVTGTGSLVLGTNPTIGITSTGSTTSRSLQNRFADTVNAADYGAAPTNPDNTAALNAAAAAISASGTKGGCIKINQGWHAIAGTVTLPDGVGLCGSGHTLFAVGTQLNGTGASGQVMIDIGNGSDNPMYNVVQDLLISFSNPQSAGAGIRVRNAVAPLLQRLTFYDNYYDAIVLSGAPVNPNYTSRDYYLRDIIMYGAATARRGVWVGAPIGGNPSTVINFVMDDVTIGGPIGSNTVDAFYLQNVGGVQAYAGETRGVGRGLVIAPGDNETVDGVIWSGTYFDGSYNGAAIAVVPTGSPGCNPYTHPTDLPLCGRAAQLQLVNTRPSYTLGGVGALFDSTGGGVINGVVSTNMNAGLNDEEGIKILGSNTKHLHFVNTQLSYNNTGNSGKAGAYIGPGVSHVTFNGGCASTCSTQNPLTVNYQKYGFEVDGGVDNYIIQGMDLSDNVTAAVLIDGASSNFSVFNNIGYENILPAPFRLYDRTLSNYSMVIDGILNTNGGAAIMLQGDGVSTPDKTIRAHQGQFQIVNSAFTGLLMTVGDTGVTTINDTSTNDYSMLINAAANTAGGASIKLGGDGVTTPNKTIRAHLGEFQITNSGFSSVIFSVTDAGLATANNMTVGTGAYTGRTVNGAAAGNLNLNAVTGQSVVLQVNGSSLAQMLATTFQPVTTNTISSGSSGNRWSNTYSVLGNFSGAVTMSSNLSVGGTLQVTQASPAAGAACTAGQIAVDANYIYTCSASAAWKRVAVTGGY